MKRLFYALGLLCLVVIFSSCENSQGLDDNAIEIPEGVLYYTKSTKSEGYLEKVFEDGSNKTIVKKNALMLQYPVKGKIIYNVYDKISDSYNLYSSNYDGSNEKVLSTISSSWTMQFISADERYLIKYGNSDNQLISVDRKTGKETVISSNLAYEVLNELSPDGKKIAYQEKTDNDEIGALYIVNVDGTGKIKLTDYSYHHHDLLRVMSWSMDSKYLAAIDTSQTKVLIFSSDGTLLNTINCIAGKVYFPVISPENNLVAYSVEGNLVLNNFQGTNQKIIAPADNINEIFSESPVFSPNGKYIAFFRGDNNGNISLLKYNIETGTTSTITNIDFNGADGDKYMMYRIFWL